LIDDTSKSLNQSQAALIHQCEQIQIQLLLEQYQGTEDKIISCLATNRTGDILLIGYRFGIIEAWHIPKTTTTSANKEFQFLYTLSLPEIYKTQNLKVHDAKQSVFILEISPSNTTSSSSASAIFATCLKDDNIMTFFDLITGHYLFRINSELHNGEEDKITACHISANGELIAIAYSHDEILIVSLHLQMILTTISQGHDQEVPNSLVFSYEYATHHQDENLLTSTPTTIDEIVSCNYLFTCSQFFVILMWDYLESTVLATFNIDNWFGMSLVTQLSYYCHPLDPSNQHLLLARPGHVDIWHIPTASLIWSRHLQHTTNAAFLPWHSQEQNSPQDPHDTIANMIWFAIIASPLVVFDQIRNHSSHQRKVFRGYELLSHIVVYDSGAFAVENHKHIFSISAVSIPTLPQENKQSPSLLNSNEVLASTPVAQIAPLINPSPEEQQQQPQQEEKEEEQKKEVHDEEENCNIICCGWM
jgi:hypothetical protein